MLSSEMVQPFSWFGVFEFSGASPFAGLGANRTVLCLWRMPCTLVSPIPDSGEVKLQKSSISALQRNEETQVLGAGGLGDTPSQLPAELGTNSGELCALLGSQPT